MIETLQDGGEVPRVVARRRAVRRPVREDRASTSTTTRCTPARGRRACGAGATIVREQVRRAVDLLLPGLPGLSAVGAPDDAERRSADRAARYDRGDARRRIAPRTELRSVPEIADAPRASSRSPTRPSSSSNPASRWWSGPNGSGKSNLVDAVAWVLGAQGPRTVRGGKMDDVIFAGTAERPALGRAEVSLTHRQHRRPAADRVHRGHDHPHAVPRRATASTRSTARRAGCSTSRSCSPTPASAASST